MGFVVGFRKTTLTLLLVLTLVLISFPQIKEVNSQATIYINSDGSIQGTDLIQITNNNYTFTNDISGNFVVLRDSITIDGAGFTLQGSGDSSQTGINLTHRKNVTITNLVLKDYFTGIFCRPGTPTTTNITILGNYIQNCDNGIEFQGTSNNLVKLNTFKNNSIDIAINYVLGDNLITQNSIDSYIQVFMSDQPTIDRNYWVNYNGTDNDGDGIGDTPYYYHGTLQDNHPLIDPVPVIPEFSSCTILPLFLMTALVIILYRKRLRRKFTS